MMPHPLVENFPAFLARLSRTDGFGSIMKAADSNPWCVRGNFRSRSSGAAPAGSFGPILKPMYALTGRQLGSACILDRTPVSSYCQSPLFPRTFFCGVSSIASVFHQLWLRRVENQVPVDRGGFVLA
jgi:hypothetical protein